MTSVELSPTLRAQLDVLAPYLDDREVTEILIAGPHRVFVTRRGRSQKVDLDLGETRIRALADRVLRALDAAPRSERKELSSGRISDDLEVSVVGAPRGPRCPLLRVYRRGGVIADLDPADEDALIDRPVRAELERAVAERRSTLIVGPHGARTRDLVIALARSWSLAGRVVAFEDAPGPLGASGIAEVVLDPSAGARAAAIVAADVIVAEAPPPALWAEILKLGRPFVVALEAPDAATSIGRAAALALAGDASLSRGAGEALVASSVAAVVEVSAAGVVVARRFESAPTITDGLDEPRARAPSSSIRSSALRDLAPSESVSPPARVRAEPPPAATTWQGRDSAAALSSAAGTPVVPRPDRPSRTLPMELLDISPEELVSQSFIVRLARGQATNVQEDPGEDLIGAGTLPSFGGHDRTAHGPLDEGAKTPSLSRRTESEGGDRVRPASAVEALEDDPALDPESTMAPDLETPARSFAALDDEDEVDDDGPPERRASERMATLVGRGDVPPRPGAPDWARQEFDRFAGDDPDATATAEPSSPFDTPAPFDGADIMTSSGIAAPTLDPFDLPSVEEVGDAGDHTQAAQLRDMVAPSPGGGAPSVRDVRDSRIDRAGKDEWDSEGPSEVMDRRRVRLGMEPGPFENEATPYAPILKDQAKKAKAKPAGSTDAAIEALIEELEDLPAGEGAGADDEDEAGPKRRQRRFRAR